MKNLLVDLDNSIGKTPWQCYTVKHGIETIDVLVPLKNAQVFEVEFKSKKFNSKNSLIEFITSVGGELKQKSK